MIGLTFVPNRKLDYFETEALGNSRFVSDVIIVLRHSAK